VLLEANRPQSANIRLRKTLVLLGKAIWKVYVLDHALALQLL
jgi:hypothetical protein